MGLRRSVLGTRILVLALLLGSVSSATVRVPLCDRETAADYILGFRDRCYGDDASDDSLPYPRFVSVTEGDEKWLQMAMDMIHKNKCDYVAVLFYASWCPFSRSLRPSFDVISSLYSSIPHFAIEESTVRPSLLSKYGVHGFPTLFLLNSTMRVRYRGQRTLGSLAAFYTDVTGIKTASLDKTSLDKSGSLPHPEKHNNTEQECCPFPWARSPENLLRQETCLALATAFVLSRLLYLIFPNLLAIAKFLWRRVTQNIRSLSLLEHPLAFLSRVVQLCKSLKEPCKRSNLQGGAMNARVWASKSLATVSIGDASTSRATTSQ